MDAYILGQKQSCFAKVEATYDTLQAFVAADAVKLLTFKLSPEYALEATKEHTASGSRNGLIPGRKGGKWSASGYFYLNGAGVAPECAAFLQAAYGKETVVGGTSVTYTINNAETPKSLQLGRLTDTNFYEVATGCVVEKLTIKSSNERPVWEAEGSFATYGSMTPAKCAAAGALTGASTVPLLAAHAGSIRVNSVLYYTSSGSTYNNTGAGYTVTAVSTDGATITVSPVLEHGITENDPLIPFAVAPSYGGTLMGASASMGALTIASRTMRYREHALSFTTGRHTRDDEAISDRPTGVIPGKALVDGQISAVFVDSDYGPFVGRAWDIDGHALVNRLGPNTAGSRMTLNAPNVFFKVVGQDFPEANETMVQLSYEAHQNAAEYDEHTLVLD